MGRIKFFQTSKFSLILAISSIRYFICNHSIIRYSFQHTPHFGGGGLELIIFVIGRRGVRVFLHCRPNNPYPPTNIKRLLLPYITLEHPQVYWLIGHSCPLLVTNCCFHQQHDANPEGHVSGKSCTSAPFIMSTP